MSRDKDRDRERYRSPKRPFNRIFRKPYYVQTPLYRPNNDYYCPCCNRLFRTPYNNADYRGCYIDMTGNLVCYQDI